MDWMTNIDFIKVVFDIITLGELLVLLTMYFRPRRPRRCLADLLLALVPGGALFVLLNAMGAFDLYVLVGVLLGMTILYGLLFLEGNWLYKTVVCVYFCVTYFQLHSAELVFWDLLLPRPHVMRLFLAQAGMCLVLWANRKLGAWYCEDTPPIYVLTLLLSSALSMLICLVLLPKLVPYPTLNGMSLTLCLGTLGVNMTAFYQGQQLMRAYREKLELRAVSDRIRADSHLARETASLMEEMRTQRHEQQNRLLVIRALCDAGDLAGLSRYVDTLCPTPAAEEAVDCGHVIVNAVLNQKLAQAARAKIPLTLDAHLPPQLPIRDSDLCSLLANLLDNAMEGSRDVQAPRVRLQAATVKNYLRIRVSNRVSHDVLRDNPQLDTTKARRESHGIGIPVIRQIVARYDGMLDFSMQGDEFVAEALLKLEIKTAGPVT